MPPPLLLSVQDACVSFGKTPLFEDLSFNIHDGNKICLIGKNGAGKSTLMNIIVGRQELDTGKRIELPGLCVGYLTQDLSFDPKQKVFDYLFSGLKEENQSEDYYYMVDVIAEPLKIDTSQEMGHLSGGQLRRAALAHALIENPDILLLDEPTNHLDFESVLWLEGYLNNYRGSLICISHDRAFLKNISDKVFWLDRGKIKVCPKGYSYFEEWSEILIQQEKRELENRQKAVSLEETWANRGVKARRKRNVRRLEVMRETRDALKADKSLFSQTMQKLELAPISPSMSSKIVAEFIKVGKKFDSANGEKTILENFNLRLIKGDKIGILGKNGAGKTTFLKMLIGNLEADSGKVKLSRNIEIAYFDQKRSDLMNDQSIWKNLIPGGGDYINVMGKARHVCGYLKDFMFDPKSIKDQVSTLSGGQKNRLMLAKVLANPGNCLILDEPTNDLDMDTLDMLEEILANYKGTLLVVSHDRDFLDKTVNKIIAFKGEGEVEYHIGGYTDYANDVKEEKEKAKIKANTKINKDENNNNKKPEKLTYKLQYELDNLPKNIEKLNDELNILNEQFCDPEFFENIELRDKSLKRSKDISEELEELENRWLELEEMKEG
jgi:ATP-binding cassette subfamily F protein uup